jgi:uncharacterized protein
MRTLEAISTILKKNKSRFRKVYKVREIGVFGSYARRRQKESSDVDILVEFDESPDLFTFLEFEGRLEKLLKTRVDLVTKQALRPELKERILSEVIYV